MIIYHAESPTKMFYYLSILHHVSKIFHVGQSNNHNYKYMGIDALGRVIQINPDFAEQHQLAVIDCLEV